METPNEVNEFSDERVFLHAIATPLTVAIGMTDVVLSTGQIDEKSKERLQKVLNASKKIEELLKNRRDVIKTKLGAGVK